METVTLSIENYNTLLKQLMDLQDRLNKLNDRKKFIEQEYVDSWEAARLLKISRRTLERYRDKNLVPCFRLNRKVYYRTSDIEFFLQKKSELVCSIQGENFE